MRITLATVALLGLLAQPVHAAVLTFQWTQPQGCASLAGWEILAAPITERKPNPAVKRAEPAGVIPNDAAVRCEPHATANVAVDGLGRRRLWLRALGTRPNLDSPTSEPLDVNLPLIIEWPAKCTRLIVARHDDADNEPRIQWQPNRCDER